MTGGVIDLGPIRPDHATDGWRLDGDEYGWWLATTFPGGWLARIYATTPTTVAWTMFRDGAMVREESARDVDTAKAHVKQWIQGDRR